MEIRRLRMRSLTEAPGVVCNCQDALILKIFHSLDSEYLHLRLRAYTLDQSHLYVMTPAVISRSSPA
jgi:hypothetical protein